eukprot:61615_1
MPESPYFVDHKRGEINELQGLLRNAKVDKNPAQKREVIKKVIAYMTLGIDVSRLFSEMIMATHTQDLVQKKMVYLYLCTYAIQKPELTILAINTLQKDGQDDDPMVRGLALRSLCSLRLPDLAEYVEKPIRAGLKDSSAYVRKTAVVGVAKLFRISPESIQDSDFIDMLYDMLKDRDVLVVQNVIMTLNDILSDEGGMAVNRPIIMHLMSRLKEFNEWGQCIVLEVISKFKTAEQQEIFRIMNILNDRLKHSNSAVVLATVKVFLTLTQEMPEVCMRVYESIREPLMTLMSSQTFEISYPVLSHVSLLVSRQPAVFEDSYKHFFCRYNDPPSVKSIKMNTLIDIAAQSNSVEILAELSEYVTDVNVNIAKQAIMCIGRLAVKVNNCVDLSIEHLLGFLDLKNDYVSTSTFVVMKNILRKYPDCFPAIVPHLHSHMSSMDEAEGKAAAIWMIGEYGGDENMLDDAPYVLESFIDAYEEEPHREVRLELLTATVKLFFKRPPEVQLMLGRLLKAAIDDTSSFDIRDRALLYYRLLEYDVHEAARVINCPKVVVNAFIEADDFAMKDRIFEEFNTLSVLYGKPSEKFIENRDFFESSGEESDSESDDNQESGSLLPAESGIPDVVESNVATTEDGGDLLDFAGLALPPQPALSLQLAPSPNVSPQEFQKRWPAMQGRVETLTLSDASENARKRFEELARGAHFRTMASGTVGRESKFYFYAQEAKNPSEGLILMEVKINLDSCAVNATIKCQKSSSFDDVVKLFH